MADEVQPSKLAKTPHTPFPKLPADEFVKITSYYQGPNVKIYVNAPESGPEDTKVYELPRKLLTHRSPFFEAAFNGSFLENDTQELHLECSSAAFDLMVQFIYTDNFVLPASAEESGAVKMDLLLDFIILTDRLLLGPNIKAIAQVKKIIKKSGSSLEPRHVRKATENLPLGHELREVFALACVWSYIVNHQKISLSWHGVLSFRFMQEVEELEGFASDLFKAHRKIHQDGKLSDDGYTMTNPVTGESLKVMKL